MIAGGKLIKKSHQVGVGDQHDVIHQKRLFDVRTMS